MGYTSRFSWSDVMFLHWVSLRNSVTNGSLGRNSRKNPKVHRIRDIFSQSFMVHSLRRAKTDSPSDKIYHPTATYLWRWFARLFPQLTKWFLGLFTSNTAAWMHRLSADSHFDRTYTKIFRNERKILREWEQIIGKARRPRLSISCEPKSALARAKIKKQQQELKRNRHTWESYTIRDEKIIFSWSKTNVLRWISVGGWVAFILFWAAQSDVDFLAIHTSHSLHNVFPIKIRALDRSISEG